jgi:catechol 2,3-dioxygenase-like lactoylglutathione lyase family enzyme
MIIGLDHVQLTMPAGKEGDARQFYSGLLGLPEKQKPTHLIARGGVWFESASVRIHLGVDADFRPARKAHPGLLVAGLREMVISLRASGVHVVDGEALDGYEHVYVDDPFGNRLELMEQRR